MKKRMAISALLLIVGVACTVPRHRDPAAINGRYRFVERISEATPPVKLEGYITVAAPEVELELVSRACRYDDRSSATAAVFDCDDVDIIVDRRSPSSQSSYSLRTTLRRPVRACEQYQTTSQGDRRCVRWGTRYEEYIGTRSGRLQLLRIPG